MTWQVDAAAVILISPCFVNLGSEPPAPSWGFGNSQPWSRVLCGTQFFLSIPEMGTTWHEVCRAGEKTQCSDKAGQGLDLAEPDAGV